MALNPGDLLFVGWDADNEDVAFITTVPIPGGEVIYFTDDERDATGFFGSEQLFEWTVPVGGIPIGTVVTIDMISGAGATATIDAGGSIDYIKGGGALAGGNEMLWAFQGTRVGNTVTPTNYIGVIANEADGTNTQTPNLTGTGLTTTNGGAIIIDGDEDWMEFTGEAGLSSPVDRAELIAEVSDLSNWSTADGTGNNNPNPGGVGFVFDFPSVVCFAAGSFVETPSGPRLIESIREGDFVNTIDHGPRQVKWVGSRRLSAEDLAIAPHLKPILIPKHTFGLNVPARDMLLSPQHRILFEGWAAYKAFATDEILVPAKAVFDPVSTVEEVTYIHILFRAHEVITCDGLRSESFHPGPIGIGALEERSRAELFDVFPELATGDLSRHGGFARPVATVKEGRSLFAVAQ